LSFTGAGGASISSFTVTACASLLRKITGRDPVTPAVKGTAFDFGWRPFRWVKSGGNFFEACYNATGLTLLEAGMNWNWIHSTHPFWRFTEVVGYLVILTFVFVFIGFRESAFFLAVGVLLALKALKWARTAEMGKIITAALIAAGLFLFAYWYLEFSARGRACVTTDTGEHCYGSPDSEPAESASP
jgi:hypothetical protein